MSALFLSFVLKTLLHNMSKGEDKIESLLKKKQVRYVKEKTFPALRNGKLRFDFYLPETQTLIEVDGEQHFKFTDYFYNSKKEFNHAKQNDYYKNSFALSHNYKLYRIPFWELPNIQHYSDIFQTKFRVTTKWWNDQIYRKYLSEGHRKWM